jgi:hypothetical protein
MILPNAIRPPRGTTGGGGVDRSDDEGTVCAAPWTASPVSSPLQLAVTQSATARLTARNDQEVLLDMG